MPPPGLVFKFTENRILEVNGDVVRLILMEFDQSDTRVKCNARVKSCPFFSSVPHCCAWRTRRTVNTSSFSVNVTPE